MRSRVLAAVLAVAGIGLVQLGPGAASAQTPTPGLNFWISVEGVPDCNTQTGNSACELAPGSTFVIEVTLDPLPSSLPQYDGFDISLRHTGPTPNQDANADAWPDCAFQGAAYDEVSDSDPEGNIVSFGCAIGIPPAGPSTYTGLIGTVSFNCAQSGTITLLHNGTDLVDDLIQPRGEDSPDESLTINCVQGGVEPPPVTPHTGATTQPAVTPLEPTAAAIATSTAEQQATATAIAVATAGKRTPGTTGGDDDDGGDGLAGWLIAVIIVGGVAAAGAAGVVGWRVMQSRGGGGAPPA